MRVVDASAWIESLRGSATGNAISPEVPAGHEWLVPTIIQLELAKWLAREVDEATADKIIAFTYKCIVVPLDSKIALLAADLCSRHKFTAADAIIYATTLEYGADLLTCDAHFDGLSHVKFISKKGF